MYTTINKLHKTCSYFEELDKQENIKVEVVFGNPQKGCRGSGICRVSTSFASEDMKEVFQSCRKAIGQINLSSSEGVLKLDIYKSSMCSRVIRKYFSSDTFYMPEPSNLLFGRHHEKELILLPGEYTITETSSHFTLYLLF